MNIIGLNAFHGDASACLLVDGQLVAAAEEERFCRIKHWAGFPKEAIAFCLQKANLSLADIDVVAINSDSKAAKRKKISYALSGKASLALLKEKLLIRQKRKNIEQYLQEAFPKSSFSGRIDYVEHHDAHLASAYLVSPFDKASVISIDGFGDFASAAWGVGDGQTIQVDERVYFPHSLGVFYQAMTQYLGFPNYGDEYKVMGLASYGEPNYRDQMDEVLKPNKYGQAFELNLDYFTHHKHPVAYNWEGGAPQVSQLYTSKLDQLFGTPRKANEPLQQHHKDIARSVQDAYERTLFRLLNSMHELHQVDALSIAGGCGMNSVANGKIHLNTPYQKVYVQPAAGDAGGAIGAAMVASQKHKASKFVMSHAYWGAEYDDGTLAQLLDSNKQELGQQDCRIQKNVELDSLVDQVSDHIINGKVIGWFQGAMEWGPRALGNRSIIGDPRRADMKDILNLKIKRRESFRPFAPSVLREHVNDWFESDADVPFMMKVFQIRSERRSKIPAVTHIDGSGRLQTVTADSNPRYYQLIQSFYKKTNVPMLLNTSFNENEPIVCKPEEALDCFLRTNMDVLVLGSHIVERQSQE